MAAVPPGLPPGLWVAWEQWATEEVAPAKCEAYVDALSAFFRGATFGGFGAQIAAQAGETLHDDVSNHVAPHVDNVGRVPETALRHFVVFLERWRHRDAPEAPSPTNRAASTEELAFFAEGDDGVCGDAAAAPPPETAGGGFAGVFGEVQYVLEEAVAESLAGGPRAREVVAAVERRSTLEARVADDRGNRGGVAARRTLLGVYDRYGARVLEELTSGATLDEFLLSRAHRVGYAGENGERNRPLALVTTASVRRSL